MREIALSIVVPIYNVQSYLDETLRSVAVLSEESDIEVLLMDDGSTDGSADIAKTYCERYPSFFQYHRLAHGGVSVTRNAGIDLAAGKWLLFCDGDDLLIADSVRAMIKCAKEEDLDLVFTQIEEFDAYNSHVYAPTKRLSECRRVEIDNTDLLWNFMISGKLYRRAMLLEHQIRFPKLAYSEDAVFQMTAVRYARKMGGCAVVGCRYRKRLFCEQQSVTQQYTKKLWEEFCLAHRMVEKIVQEGIFPRLDSAQKENWQQAFCRKMAESLISSFYSSLWLCAEEIKDEIVQSLQGYMERLDTVVREEIVAGNPDMVLWPHVYAEEDYCRQKQVAVILAEGFTNADLLWSIASAYSQRYLPFELIVPSCYEAALGAWKKKLNLHIVPHTGEYLSDEVVRQCVPAGTKFFMFLDRPGGFLPYTLRRLTKWIDRLRLKAIRCEIIRVNRAEAGGGDMQKQVAEEKSGNTKDAATGKLYRTEDYLQRKKHVARRFPRAKMLMFS